MRAYILIVLGQLSVLSTLTAHADEPPRFPFRDGDRIVLVGDTLVERDQRYGFLETILTIRNPDKNLTFRNLGWSGDTVAGISRSGFDPPAAGYEQLAQQILAAKPTVVIVGYGMADSFAGERGLSTFEGGLNRLLDLIAGTGARVVMLSPIAHENLGRPWPDPAKHNYDLGLYRDVIRKVADHRKYPFVDLFDYVEMTTALPPPRQLQDRWPITEDGIHLGAEGYWGMGVLIGDRLGQGLAVGIRGLQIEKSGEIVAAQEARVSPIEKTAGGFRFAVVDDLLVPPFPKLTGGPRQVVSAFAPWRLRIAGLAPGRYQLKIDGRVAANADADGWAQSVSLEYCPEFDQVEKLRATIKRKNTLFFDRWRPQNITYLFGFRKHEQGNNAIEIPQFDPLVAEQEREIARLRKPVPHVYELVRTESEVAR